ncbi:hypothetical protein [Streptomyces olivaceus]|uniref:hypothetical protein n=1 Tax=Streptomyces olivaceus TaxID=47716 RepID=UPI000B00E0DD|nr:hypothetical protein [Streptomyces olivaceus]MBZ6102762.1 hypothetical protein [Streptomyces olivaceus]
MSRCAACGRRLRRPSPTGLGPVCARRLAPTARPSATVRAAPPPDHHVPGQTELDLTDHQPSLWSL